MAFEAVYELQRVIERISGAKLPIFLENEWIAPALAEHQAEQPDGYPYGFVPPFRYERIQVLRKQGKWSARKGNEPVNNFRKQFSLIMARAGIERGTFHDLRRTCLTNWFANGLAEFEVMYMAGHASFDTTRRFYLSVRDDLVDLARMASHQAAKAISGCAPVARPHFGAN